MLTFEADHANFGPQNNKIIKDRCLMRQNQQDHRGIKNITKYTLGFRLFESAESTIAGVELHRMLKKGQMKNTGNTPA